MQGYRKQTKRNQQQKSALGFTIMEIVVATTLFAILVSGLLSLFNYTLKINRKSEALREATQGMRNFVEFLVKEVRNGQIDYGISNGGVKGSYPISPCSAVLGQPTYNAQDNKLGIVTSNGDEECIYLAYGPGGSNSAGSPIGPNIFTNNTDSSSPNYNPNPILALKKYGIPGFQSLNPPNYRIENLMFVIRPVCDPYTLPNNPSACYTTYGGLPKIQPVVTIIIKFVAQLPTGESVAINYQTSVSENTYDIPSQ